MLKRALVRLVPVLLVLACLSPALAGAPPSPLPIAPAESEGFAPDRLELLHRRIKSVELMLANELTHTPAPTNQFSDTDGFGYGGAVRMSPARANELGSAGQFGWTGAATTYFNIDPHERTVALVFAQHFPHDAHHLFWTFSTLFYGAMVDTPAR